jgi:hypothetical protein
MYVTRRCAVAALHVELMAAAAELRSPAGEGAIVTVNLDAMPTRSST